VWSSELLDLWGSLADKPITARSILKKRSQFGKSLN
jgi:hypothetical protein